MKERHLLGVWNPSYASDVMEAHLRLLLDRVAESRAGKLEDEPCVFWGKVRSQHRQERLPHLAQILAMNDELPEEAGSGPELHLYLTDYRSLYVGHVYEITADDVTRDEAQFVPRYYLDRDLRCDCWFRLGDIRRLVQDDTVAVIAELRKLRNTHYHDMPVSLYGGMVDLPLIVTRDDGARFFEPAIREALLGNKLWVEADAERGGIGAIERDLRDNLFGDEAWDALDLSARTFIASAEKVFRENLGDGAFDFTGVVVDLAKACEVQANTVVRRALAGAAPKERTVNVDGRPVDLARDAPLTLGAIGRILGDNGAVRDALRRRTLGGEWLLTSGGAVLQHLARHRNPAAHTEPVSRDDARRLRNQLLGIGCHGDLVQLAKVRLKG